MTAAQIIGVNARSAGAAVIEAVAAPAGRESAPPSAAQSPWRLAGRAARMNPSAIREILKLTEQPGIISLAGGLPSADAFPLDAIREATSRVLAETPREALQYAPSEGFGPLREWVAADLAAQRVRVDAGQVLITTGSQQGLDLVGKVLIDKGSRVAVETPTYLGALQSFATYEPQFVSVGCDDQGPLPNALRDACGAGSGEAPRFMYLLPTFQNPTGRCMPAPRRAAIAAAARELGLPIVEDNPYGELWFDAAPPAPLASHWPAGTVYLGSFSKVLAPGLRLGYVVAPPELTAKLVQAKQASDLHTSGFNQRVVHEVIRGGFLRDHLPTVRSRYRVQRDAMNAALETELGPGSGLGCRWNVPAGGMFFWLELPPGIDAAALLPLAVANGVAFVPGAAFYAGGVRADTLRLSFVTVSAEQIGAGVAALARSLKSLAEEPA